MKTKLARTLCKRKLLQAIIILIPILLLSSSLAQADGPEGFEGRQYLLYAYEDVALLTVDTLADENDGSCGDGDCSLRDAIAVAQTGDTIDFGVTGTITLTLGQLTIGTDLTINGPGASSLILSGDDASRVFWINENINATISGLTIADGQAQDGGGIFNQGGILNMSNCTLSGNRATYDGGGISNRFDGTLNVSNSVFIGNEAVRNGGSIDNRDTLSVSNSTFTGDSAGNWGGGIYNYTGIVTVIGSTFSGNGEYTDVGGGICNHQGAFQVTDSEFSANNARVSGGGIYNEDVLTVTGSDFISNTTARGGGIHNTSELTVVDSIFSNNSVSSNGGGIHNTSVLTVTNSTFYSNTAEWGGGIENFDVLNVTNSTFYSNTVVDTGGGICSHGALTMTNSTFYSNTAGTRGGGINNNEGTLHATNCTFSGNRAGDSGGGIRNEETATLVNTIVANSSAGGNCGGAALDAASTNGLSTDTTCSPGFTQTTAAALALDWQGWVFELITASVAIDAGTNIGCPATDQLGQHRPQDGDGNGTAICDVGSFEFSGAAACLTELHIDGPTSGMVGAAYAFTATVSPPSATLPIAYDWQPPPTGGSGTVLLPTTHVATYTWSTAGPQTITLTASNACNTLTQTHTITLQPAKLFLPLIARNWPPPTWHVQQVDARRMFEDVTHRSLVLDSQGRPHVAVGYQELYHAWHDGSAWQFEVIDEGPWVGRWASLALDSADRPHVSYYDWENTCLKYARWDGAAWQIESLDCEGLVGWETHIVLDGDDYPHISYTKAVGMSQKDLRYAHWDGAQWIVETIEAGSDSRVGGDNSLALDSAGQPHVSYNDSGSGADPYCLKHAVRVGGTWQIETVEDGGFVGSNSLAIDDADHLHVVYERAETEEHLKHAYWDGATWQIETVLTHDSSLGGISLVLDNGQQPHFSYYHNTAPGLRDVRYAHWDGAAWQVETADTDLEGINWMEETSLALGDSGAPHIVHYLQDSVLLRYAQKSGATWQTETVDKGGVVGGFASLALDGADRPHIAYYEEQDEDLLYATWDGAQWQITTVDTAASSSTDGSVSLALDAAGRPHISYRDDTDAVALDPHGLKYAHWDGAAWQIQYVDQEGIAGRGSAIVVDAAGRPHISYYDAEYINSGEDSLRYATWDGGSWQVQTVDPVRLKYIGSPTSLALDGAGRPHIAYQDGDNEDLKYARWDGATWQIQTVDSTDDVGIYPSLALDSADQAHVSYRDRTNGDLKYAHWDGAQWQTETVTDTGDVGYFTSLALDSADRPHVTYYDETSGGLCYAHWTGTAWKIDALVTGDQAYYTSLALDSAGQPHVAYQNYSRGDLEYAWFGP
jgi:CSLREA domain-containing protein